MGIPGAPPHTRPLDVYADYILRGVEACKPHSVFSPAASELQGNGIAVAEPFRVPLSLKFVVTPEHLLKRGLDNTVEPFHLRPPGVFVLAQNPGYFAFPPVSEIFIPMS
ncbi:MAG: hypothetical protein BWY89_01826 [Bacteroidetes bacterium ADurb.BinA012]|nr:MAG: hypothetical protein BWY89_01826 [Bacteroidetes bacterium ADurb.BinA012]